MLKMLNLLGLGSLATLLAIAAFVGYLSAVGRLSGKEFSQIGAILRGESTPLSAAPTTQPTTQPTATQPAALTERPPRQRQYIESLMMDRARRDMQAQKALLDQAMGQVVREQEDLEHERTQFEKSKTESKKVALDVGFQRERELFINLPPDQAKNHIVNSWPDRKADMVRLFMSIDTLTAKKILAKCETDAEKKVASELLTQIRLQGGENADPQMQEKKSRDQRTGGRP